MFVLLAWGGAVLSSLRASQLGRCAASTFSCYDADTLPVSLADSFMDALHTVLQIIALAPQPLSWYGIEIRLGMKGIILDVNLIDVLRSLEARGFIRHHEQPGYPHGCYRVTEAGRACLAGA